MALGPENLAYMILNEKGQFYMALHLAAIGKKKKSSLKKLKVTQWVRQVICFYACWSKWAPKLRAAFQL